ncbi:hypothetical protein D9M70_545220 [compost metagenome]
MHVEPPATEAVGARRLDFPVGNTADGTGEDLDGVGAGVQGERQQRAIHRIAEEGIQHRLRAHGGDAVNAGVDDQQLDVERRAAEQVGEELHRPAQ